MVLNHVKEIRDKMTSPKVAASDLGARTFLRWYILSCQKWDKYKLKCSCTDLNYPWM